LAIEVRLDLMLVRRKVSLTDLSERVGVSLRNLSLLKTGKVKGIRFRHPERDLPGTGLCHRGPAVRVEGRPPMLR
jgi:hypothetical protein